MQDIEFYAKTNLNIRCNLKYYSKSDARSYIYIYTHTHTHVRWTNFQPTNHLDKLHSKLHLPLQRTGTFASIYKTLNPDYKGREAILIT
jgi:hypothetical protein